MKTFWYATLALLSPWANAHSSEMSHRVISTAEAEEFIRHPGTIVFAKHAIPFDTSEFVLLRGKNSDRDGMYGCRYPLIDEGSTPEEARGRDFGEIDIAVKQSQCEKIVERGYYKAK